jgi:hypothetical protein
LLQIDSSWSWRSRTPRSSGASRRTGGVRRRGGVESRRGGEWERRRWAKKGTCGRRGRIAEGAGAGGGWSYTPPWVTQTGHRTPSPTWAAAQ